MTTTTREEKIRILLDDSIPIEPIEEVPNTKISNEIIEHWKHSLNGLAKWADDEQDVKVADKYFACEKLLKILEEIVVILHRELY
jgi:hypothetical protein